MTSLCSAHQYFDSACEVCVSSTNLTNFTGKKRLVLTWQEMQNDVLLRAALRMKNTVVVLSKQGRG
jgi:hypothetical protein